MELTLTPLEEKRIRAFLEWDAEEQVTPVEVGHLRIERSGIGSVLYAVKPNGKRRLINEEDVDSY